MFEASSTVLLLDYFRVPYTVRPSLRLDADAPETDALGHLERLVPAQGGGAILWPTVGHGTPSVGGPWLVGTTPLFGQVVPDSVSRRWFRSRHQSWRPVLPIRNRDGEVVASIWEDSRQNVFIPFDPGEAILNLWSERYLDAMRGHRSLGVRRGALRVYYRARPLIPRSSQIWLRRRLAQVQARTPFPSWPEETALHDLYALLLGILADVADRPVPYIASWPAGFDWALVLTHDVETEIGYERMDSICELEATLGYRSSWNFVPKRYEVSESRVRQLSDAGFEVGVHGLYHDGRDLESLELLRRRLPAIREYAERWRADGFRGPATHRRWEWMPLLGFAYDSSYPDTDPFEPQAGGCCSWLPYTNGDLVELPITLPQDHTLFVILGHEDGALWMRKADFLRDRGGMALLITHPDYFHHRGLAPAYEAFLERYAADMTAWRTLPRDAAAWWQRRGASALEPANGGWTVVGPAAGEADIRLVHPVGTLETYAA